MSLSIVPLKKELFAKATELGVKEIILHFSGGNDEGYLNVELNPSWNTDFAQEVEEWAWDVYGYNGAGDGSDYGDDITYDLANKKASSEEWYMTRSQGDSAEVSFDDLVEEDSEKENS